MNIEYEVIGLCQQETGAIVKWLCQLEACADDERALALASRLGEALESYMGIDRDILAMSLFGSTRSRRQL